MLDNKSKYAKYNLRFFNKEGKIISLLILEFKLLKVVKCGNWNNFKSGKHENLNKLKN